MRSLEKWPDILLATGKHLNTESPNSTLSPYKIKAYTPAKVQIMTLVFRKSKGSASDPTPGFCLFV